MADLSAKARHSVHIQQGEMFRIAKTDWGLDFAELKRASDIPVSTLKGWAAGSAMPAWAIGALAEAGVPDDLASLVVDPWRRYVGTADEDEGDLDALAIKCSEFLAEYSRARHPESPGGIHIVHTEKATLDGIRRGLRAHARKVAA